jgi:5'-3' exonuclease
MSTALIDSDYLLYIIPHKMKEVSLNFNDFVAEIDKHIEYIMEQTACTHYLIFLSDKKNFRYKIARTKSYKGTRASRKPLMYADLKNYLVDNWNGIIVDDMEADDMVLIYHNYLNSQNVESVIVTTDKDLYQVPGTFYNPQKDHFVKVYPQDAKYNFWYSMLVGDSADNIGGAYNIGKKKAEKLLQTDESYRWIVFNTYLRQHGVKNGINAFTENFNLLYILREPEEFECDCQPLLFENKKAPQYEI